MVTVNDKTYPLEKAQNLADLLKHLDIPLGKGIAVAVNEMVIPKALWTEFIINQNDKIILIKATQGG
jgi:sulfur carrier protein